MEARMRPRIPERRLATVADLATDAVLTETWSSHPYWASWATKFDETDLIYYLPEVFELLILLTGKKLDYVPVWCGNQLLYAVGFYRGELPFGPFWHDDFKFKMKYVGGRMARICAFARCLQEELDVADSDRLYLWLKSFRDSNDYLTMHRLIVRRVGHLLNIDMDDHDLTKSRIVQIALGFLWHWSGENDQSAHMKRLALDTVHAGHLEVEDHHPEHEKVGVGIVNVHKLFADQFSVHLQKDARDRHGGWNIHPNFIPPQYQKEWISFFTCHMKIDLYEALDDASMRTEEPMEVD